MAHPVTLTDVISVHVIVQLAVFVNLKKKNQIKNNKINDVADTNYVLINNDAIYYYEFQCIISSAEGWSRFHTLYYDLY